MNKAEREFREHRRLIDAVNYFAVREGWGLFNDGEIQRVDCPDGGIEPNEPPFLGDDDAIEHVRALAEAGSALHLQALALHTAAALALQEDSPSSGENNAGHEPGKERMV